MSIFVQLDVRFFAHPKVVRAGARAGFLFVSGLMWSQEELTDGVIPKGVVKQLASRVDVKPSEAGALVREGLWHDYGDHWEVHDWQEWMKSRAQVFAKRAADRERQQKWYDSHVRPPSPNGHPHAVRNAARDGG